VWERQEGLMVATKAPEAGFFWPFHAAQPFMTLAWIYFSPKIHKNVIYRTAATVVPCRGVRRRLCTAPGADGWGSRRGCAAARYMARLYSNRMCDFHRIRLPLMRRWLSCVPHPAAVGGGRRHSQHGGGWEHHWVPINGLQRRDKWRDCTLK
jgi:hypothetical protein